MPRSSVLLLFCLSLLAPALASGQAGGTSAVPMETVVNESLDFAFQQSLLMAESLKDQPDKLPRTADRFGQLVTCESDWWVSGFFPGQLWYLYEHTGDERLLDWARFYSARVADQQYTTDNHDVGFMVFCSFGNGYRITRDESYLPVIRNGARSLSTRYNATTGCIKSWDAPQWQYPVIIDNMMNLELMLWASDKFDEPSWKELALSHANTTMQHHFRDDFSSYHVVSYDTLSGQPLVKQTAQGYSDDSAWARGQAWGLYGYVMVYRLTRDARYLRQAQSIADFLINHPRLPEDKIPYWDYDAPNIPDCYRDASAGAIMASALLELSTFTDGAKGDAYRKVAETQLRTLVTPAYRNALGNNGNFLLKHSVGHLPANSEVDVPLTYADYYFVEALLRYKRYYL